MALYVGGANAANGATNTTTCAVTYSPVNGNTLCVVFAGASATTPTGRYSITDNASGGSNTYIAAAGSLGYDTADAFGFQLFYCLSISGSPTIITAHDTQSHQFMTCIVDEFSGLSLFDVIGASNYQASLAAGTNAVQSGSASPAVGSVVWAATVDVAAAGTITKESTFTQAQSIAGLYMSEYLLSAPGGSMTADFTPSATSSWITGFLAFVPATRTLMPQACF